MKGETKANFEVKRKDLKPLGRFELSLLRTGNNALIGHFRGIDVGLLTFVFSQCVVTDD